mmetsp:Transcript_5388/g.10553  ORF Transcript_5388/g.10553 Transcript_5388/m.10553 type:complete len:660 (+) Transcript_5388:81-2060(+)
MPKLTKKQRAELAAKLAEEARLAAEAEAKRLKEQRIKIEALKKELAEQKITYGKEEAERLKTEAKANREVEIQHNLELKKIEAEASKTKDWSDFLTCSEIPDPVNTADLNSFVLVQREEVPENSRDIEHIIKTCAQSQRMIKETERQISKLLEEGNQGPDYKNLLGIIKELRLHSLYLLNSYTLNTLRTIDTLLDKKRIFQMNHGAHGVRFAMWVRYPDDKAGDDGVGDIEMDKIGITLSRVPATLQIEGESAGLQIMHVDYDMLSSQSDTLGPYTTIGGVFYIRRLHLPGEAIHTRGYIRRNRKTETQKLTFLRYPNDGVDTPIGDLHVSLKLPENLFITETQPMIGWWNSEKMAWCSDGHREKDTKYDAKTHHLHIKIWRLEPFAVLQPRALDFPYLDWNLMKTEGKESGVVLTLKGSRFEVKIIATSQGVSLLSPAVPGYEGVMSPGHLLLRLKKSGLNLVPTDDDAKFCHKPLKSKTLEEKSCNDLAHVVGVLDISGCRYSSSQEADVALVKIRESCYVLPEPEPEAEPEKVDPNAKPDPEVVKAEAAAKEREELLAIMTKETLEDKKLKGISDDKDGWRTVCVQEDKWMLINASKFHLRNNKPEPAEGCITHLNLSGVIKERYPGKENDLETVPALLKETVKKLLRLVRPLVFH